MVRGAGSPIILRNEINGHGGESYTYRKMDARKRFADRTCLNINEIGRFLASDCGLEIFSSFYRYCAIIHRPRFARETTMKINVVGTSGVGKSTLARRLAQELSLPYIEMDVLYWRPDWQGTSDDEFYAKLAAELAAPGWVLDGNYNRSRPVKWRDVDLVVWVDYSFWRTVRQAVCRAASRASRRQELWPGTGNYETFRRSFFSRESIILWTLKTWRNNRQRYLADMQDPQYRHIRFVRLRNQQQTENLVRELRQNSR